MATASWDGFDRIYATLGRLAHPDPSPVLEAWEDVIVEGNRRGVLAGVDGNDQPMPPLKYRGGAGKPTRNRPASKGYGKLKPAKPGVGGNLTTAEYKTLTGPRLAPRRDQSRAIANLETEFHASGANTWEVTGRWNDVVSNKGVEFLPFHFSGAGHLPRYDLRPVRAQDRAKARTILMTWAGSVLKGKG